MVVIRQMTDERLREVVRKCRVIASRVGSMHSLWDVISDAEELIKDGHPRLPRSDIERLLTQAIAEDEGVF